MATLLLRLSAPMQSWGTQSNFGNRDTGREPSKSGIIGLLCAALGRPRHESIADLAQLRMGVRIDQPGAMRRDYHTAGQGGYYKVSGGVGSGTILSERYYLSDAKFLVGLEGSEAVLSPLQTALQNPAWFLFFGRKSFIPAERVWLEDGLRDETLLTALKNYPLLGRQPAPRGRIQLVIEDPQGEIVRNDQPISFEPRRFVSRRMRTQFIDMPQPSEEG